MTINLAGTELEDEFFEIVEFENNRNDWLYCIVKNQQFQGDGGVKNLIDILKVFIAWAESCRKNNL